MFLNKLKELKQITIIKKLKCPYCNEGIKVSRYEKIRFGGHLCFPSLLKCPKCANISKIKIDIKAAIFNFQFLLLAIFFFSIFVESRLQQFVFSIYMNSSFYLKTVYFILFLLIFITWVNKIYFIEQANKESFYKKKFLIRMLCIIFLIFISIAHVYNSIKEKRHIYVVIQPFIVALAAYIFIKFKEMFKRDKPRE